jgi:AraC-like DNA-binding protein
MSSAACLPRHQHVNAYATIVLDGAYDQLAYAGRLRVGTGDVIVQPTFDCHLNRPLTSGVTLLRLAWPHDMSFGGVFRNVPMDDVVRAARHDVTEAADLLAMFLLDRKPTAPPVDDWPDLLVTKLRSEPRLAILDWAESVGVSREHLSRRFAADYGLPPVRFRLELRARQAWRDAVNSDAPLALVAQECGFSDQAHMSRSVSWLTGAPPTVWRAASHRFKTGLAC